MTEEFQYIVDKIRDAPVQTDPFVHVEITDFLSPEHLEMILNDDQIHFPETSNTNELVKELEKRDFKPLPFPGCTIDVKAYLKSLDTQQNMKVDAKFEPIEGYGVTFRLGRYRNPRLQRLMDFFNGKHFEQAMLAKFNLHPKKVNIITAIQKNLTGYEISPHCDVRFKCMTYLLNINKDDSVSDYDVHTHLLKLTKEREYCYKLWDTQPDLQRSWIPWDWCETVKRISTNNTFVLFPPSNRSLHAVKLKYPHNKFQRTQIYGNLNYPVGARYRQLGWKHLDNLKPK